MPVDFDYINSAVPPEEFSSTISMDSYENAANYACKVLIGIAKRDPIAFREALDAYRNNPYGNEIESLMTPDERAIVLEGRYGLTGFQWGWAVQTAAWLLGQPPAPNGAILTISAPATI